MNVISAYMLINKADPSTGGPYTVKFYDDDGDLIQTDVNVPQYGDAHCTLLDGTIIGGLYFKGWNPSPYNIIRNLDCYPVRGEYIIRPEEIHDSWETICAVKGAGYPFGSYKSLVFEVPAHTFTATRTSPANTEYTWSVNVPTQHIAMQMVKVAEGEDGSTSTWISTGGILNNVNVLTRLPQDDVHYKMSFDWNNSPIREWMHNIFLGCFPTYLQNAITQVTKYQKGCAFYDAGNTSLAEKSSLDKIWALSAKELSALLSSKTVSTGSDNISFSNYVENNGIDYTGVYVPTYGNRFLLRSALGFYWRWTSDPRGTFLAYARDDRIEMATGEMGQVVPFGFCL